MTEEQLFWTALAVIAGLWCIILNWFRQALEGDKNADKNIY